MWESKTQFVFFRTVPAVAGCSSTVRILGVVCWITHTLENNSKPKGFIWIWIKFANDVERTDFFMTLSFPVHGDGTWLHLFSFFIFLNKIS